MISPIAIDHVCLWVSSLKASQQFYKTIFDFTFTPREGDATTLVAENAGVHFFMSENASLDSDFFTRQHISFRVESLDRIIEHLQLLGVNDYQTGTVGFMQYKNYKWCEWRDPDGIRLECIELI